jgi:dCTP deaminase
MAYLGTEKLRALIKDKKVIDPDLNRVECGAYELSLGNEVFTTDSKDKKKEFLTQPKQQVTINPGQFALLLSHETVNIPPDKMHSSLSKPRLN